MSIPECNILENQTHAVNDSLYDFEWVFLEIPVKNCIVGMLIKRPITVLQKFWHVSSANLASL